jgi:hypothetical protein
MVQVSPDKNRDINNTAMLTQVQMPHNTKLKTQNSKQRRWLLKPITSNLPTILM